MPEYNISVYWYYYRYYNCIVCVIYPPSRSPPTPPFVCPPSSLPSPQEARKKKELQVKLKMAQFLQGTIEEMAVEGKNPKKRETVKEFAEFIEKVCLPLQFCCRAALCLGWS